jgi:hypothetical protein
MKSPASLALYALGSASAAFAACSSQVDPEYRGEPLAVISGAVSADEVGVDGLVPVLGWYDFGRPEDADGDATPALLHEVQVEGAFPNRFTMRVYDLPPEQALAPASDGEPAAAMAMIFAADPDADWSEGFGNGVPEAEGDKHPEWLAGAAINYMVLYTDGPTRADGPAARLVGEPLAKGYHLIEVHELTDEQRQERVACQNGAEVRALESYNEMFGTSYEGTFDLSDAEYEDYSQIADAESDACGSKVSMEVVPSGLEHPVQLHIGPNLEFIDWT